MKCEGSLKAWRRFYAEYVVRQAGSLDTRLIDAFAAVPREAFVGTGPWPIAAGDGYVWTPDADPRYLYQNVLIGLDTDRRIHTGEPSLHARCLAAAAPAPGEHVVHIGCGTGYYTAILAHLVGDSGAVVAVEIDSELARRAAGNLASFANVAVVNASGTALDLPPSDLIYVSAGATHPLDSWLDALNIGGRLIVPLTGKDGTGCILLVTRSAPEDYDASIVSPASFIPCIGARDDQAAESLSAAVAKGDFESVRSLRRHVPPDETAWCAGTGWWLSTASGAASTS